MYLDPQHWPCQISVQRSFTLFLTSRSPHIALQYCTGTTSQLHPLSAFHSSPFSSLYITFSLLNLVKLHNKTILVVKSIKETVGTADSRPQASRSLSSFTSPPVGISCPLPWDDPQYRHGRLGRRGSRTADSRPGPGSGCCSRGPNNIWIHLQVIKIRTGTVRY